MNDIWRWWKVWSWGLFQAVVALPTSLSPPQWLCAVHWINLAELKERYSQFPGGEMLSWVFARSDIQAAVRSPAWSQPMTQSRWWDCEATKERECKKTPLEVIWSCIRWRWFVRALNLLPRLISTNNLNVIQTTPQ